MEEGIQNLGDSKPVKKIRARKRSQGFKKKERKREKKKFLACSVFAVKNQPTHSTRLIKTKWLVLQGKDPKHRLGPGLFGTHW